MAPAYRSSGARNASTTGMTVAAPTDHATDDIELLEIESADDGAVTLTTANGFVQVTGSPVSAPNADVLIATRLTCWWRRYSGQGDPVVNDDGINHVHGQIHAFSGCVTSGDPWDTTIGSHEEVEDQTGVITGGSTSVADCLIVLLAVSAKPDAVDNPRYSAWTNADLANLTECQDGSTNTGNGGAMAMATGEKASAGAFTDTTYTHSTSTYKAHLVIALKGVSGGPVNLAAVLTAASVTTAANVLNVSRAMVAAAVGAS